MPVITRPHQPLHGRPHIIRNGLLDLEPQGGIVPNPHQVPDHNADNQVPRVIRVRVLLKRKLRRRDGEARLPRRLLPKRGVRPALHVRLLHQDERLGAEAHPLQQGVCEAHILPRVGRPRLHDHLVAGHAHGAGDVGKGLCLGLGEASCGERPRGAGEDEHRGQAVEVELGGAPGDARVEAAEAEDGVGGADGHSQLVVVVDELGVSLDLGRVGHVYGPFFFG